MPAYADFTRRLMYVGSGNSFVTFGTPYCLLFHGFAKLDMTSLSKFASAF